MAQVLSIHNRYKYKTQPLKVNSSFYTRRIDRIKSAFNETNGIGLCMAVMNARDHDSWDRMPIKHTETESVVNSQTYYNQNYENTYIIPYPSASYKSQSLIGFCTNVKFESVDVFNKLDKIELEIGGALIDTVYASQVKVLQHIYDIEDDRVIPFQFCGKGQKIILAAYHEMRITVYGTEDLKNTEIQVDYAEMEDSKKAFEYWMSASSTLNLDPVVESGVYTTTLKPHLTIVQQTVFTHIMIKLDGQIDELAFNFNTGDDDPDSISMNLSVDPTSLEIVDDHYIVPFTTSQFDKFHGVNFNTQAHTVRIVASCNGEPVTENISVFGVSTYLMRIMNDMMGVAFGN